MKELRLINTDKVAVVDDEDFERLSLFKWYLTIMGNGGIYRNYCKHYKTHHVSIAAEIMRQPKQMFDHIDRNPLNNSKSNLRPASQSQNRMNASKGLGTSSKYKGVTWLKRDKKWMAQIKFNGKRVHLGVFMLEEAAARAYDNKAIELFREFANLNFK